jgi:hypothetical protein
MSVIPQTPRASGGLSPLGPLPGLCLGPAGDLKRSPDPSPTHAPPNHKSWIRPCLVTSDSCYYITVGEYLLLLMHQFRYYDIQELYMRRN